MPPDTILLLHSPQCSPYGFLTRALFILLPSSADTIRSARQAGERGRAGHTVDHRQQVLHRAGEYTGTGAGRRWCPSVWCRGVAVPV